MFYDGICVFYYMIDNIDKIYMDVLWSIYVNVQFKYHNVPEPGR